MTTADNLKLFQVSYNEECPVKFSTEPDPDQLGAGDKPVLWSPTPGLQFKLDFSNLRHKVKQMKFCFMPYNMLYSCIRKHKYIPDVIEICIWIFIKMLSLFLELRHEWSSKMSSLLFIKTEILLPGENIHWYKAPYLHWDYDYKNMWTFKAFLDIQLI